MPRVRDRQRKTVRYVLVDRADLDTFIKMRKRGDGSRSKTAKRVQRQKQMIV